MCWDAFVFRSIMLHHVPKVGSLVFRTPTLLLDFPVLTTCGHFLLCYRFGGNTWLWTKVTEWRITTASWLRFWTRIMWPPEESSWLEPHCRISCLNCGPSSTSSSLQFLRAAAHLNSGLTLRLPWLEKGYFSNFLNFPFYSKTVKSKGLKLRTLEPQRTHRVVTAWLAFWSQSVSRYGLIPGLLSPLNLEVQEGPPHPLAFASMFPGP